MASKIFLFFENEIDTNITYTKGYPICDTIQDSLSLLLVHSFFPWTCLVLVMSHNNWKRPIIFLMIIHWILRAIGDSLSNTLKFYPHKYPYWPYHNVGWLLSYGLASVFWISSEILGDWYLVIRTKAHKLFKWLGILLQQFGSLAFDISVILTLKKYFFNNNNKKATSNILFSNNSNNDDKKIFFQKFKHLSEYRIYLSIIVIMIGFPFILSFCIGIIYKIKISHTYESNKNVYVNNLNGMQLADDTGADGIRVTVLNFPYYFMYIDQILLKIFVDESKSTKNKKIYNKYNNNTYIHYSSNHNSDQNMIYKHDNDNDNNYNMSLNNDNHMDSFISLKENNSDNDKHQSLILKKNSIVSSDYYYNRLSVINGNTDKNENLNRYSSTSRYSITNPNENINRYSSTSRYSISNLNSNLNENLNRYSSTNKCSISNINTNLNENLNRYGSTYKCSISNINTNLNENLNRYGSTNKYSISNLNENLNRYSNTNKYSISNINGNLNRYSNTNF